MLLVNKFDDDLIFDDANIVNGWIHYIFGTRDNLPENPKLQIDPCFVIPVVGSKELGENSDLSHAFESNKDNCDQDMQEVIIVSGFVFGSFIETLLFYPNSLIKSNFLKYVLHFLIDVFHQHLDLTIFDVTYFGDDLVSTIFCDINIFWKLTTR
ncbi:hypothetical protein ACJX0J_028462 [Zea mays]